MPQVAYAKGRPDAVPPAAWSRAARVAFAFCCSYGLLVWLPWNIANLLGVQWPLITVNDTLGRWPITHVLRLPEHFVPSFWASNSLPVVLAALVAAGLSLAAGAIWVILDPTPRDCSRAFAWLHAAVRYALAAEMLLYGWDKVLPGQFGRMSAGGGIDYLVHQFGQLPPRDLLWGFMEASRSYQVFTGCVEMAAGLLLLTRTTAAAGAMVSIAALGNVLMLDIGYDVSVKFFAAHLLSMAMLVAAPYLGAFRRVLRQLLACSRDYASSFTSGSHWESIGRITGIVMAVVVLAFTFSRAQHIVADNRDIPQTPLHGIWDVEAVARDGTPVALRIDDPLLWRRLVLPFKGLRASAIIVWMSDAVVRYTSTIDLDKSTIELTPIPGNVVTGSVRGLPPDNALAPQSFSFSAPDPDHLVLRRGNPDGTSVSISLKRFDPASYRLIQHRALWRW